jgi:hypothetical protein
MILGGYLMGMILQKKMTRHFEMPHDFFHFVNVPPNVLRIQVEASLVRSSPRMGAFRK